jgi:hypothetical protein
MERSPPCVEARVRRWTDCGVTDVAPFLWPLKGIFDGQQKDKVTVTKKVA